MTVQENEKMHFRAFLIIQGSQTSSVIQQNTRTRKITDLIILPAFSKFKYIVKV